MFQKAYIQKPQKQALNANIFSLIQNSKNPIKYCIRNQIGLIAQRTRAVFFCRKELREKVGVKVRFLSE